MTLNENRELGKLTGRQRSMLARALEAKHRIPQAL